MTASSIMDITGTWCKKFGKEKLKALEKPSKNAESLVATKKIWY